MTSREANLERPVRPGASFVDLRERRDRAYRCRRSKGT